MKTGRPSSYTERKAFLICTRLMMGESLKSICKRKYYPSHVTVLSWLQKFPEFLNQYTHTREVQQEFYLDEIEMYVSGQDNISNPTDASLIRVNVTITPAYAA